MIPVSAAFLQARAGHGRRCHRALVSRDSGVSWVETPMDSYRVEASRGDRVQIRYSGTVEFPPGVGEFPALAAILVRVESGFVIGDSPEWVPIATLQIVSSSRGPDGAVSVTGYSVDRRIVRANFWQPFYMGGGPARQRLQELLTPARVPVLMDPRVGEQHVAPATYESDRWQAVSDLALSVGAEVYADRMGNLRVSPVPTLDDPVAVTLDATILDRQEHQTAENAFSVVAVEGDKSDRDSIPRGYWRDTNPLSPTFVDGPFGEQVLRVALPVMQTIEQCNMAARSLGLSSRGLQSTVDVEVVQADFLDPGDVVLIETSRGVERHIIDRIPYQSRASQRLTTRAGGVL